MPLVVSPIGTFRFSILKDLSEKESRKVSRNLLSRMAVIAFIFQVVLAPAIACTSYAVIDTGPVECADAPSPLKCFLSDGNMMQLEIRRNTSDKILRESSAARCALSWLEDSAAVKLCVSLKNVSPLFRFFDPRLSREDSEYSHFHINSTGPLGLFLFL